MSTWIVGTGSTCWLNGRWSSKSLQVSLLFNFNVDALAAGGGVETTVRAAETTSPAAAGTE
jgi:hypothetical protein